MKTRILATKPFAVVLVLLVFFCSGTGLVRADEPCQCISDEEPWKNNPIYKSYIDANDPSARIFFETWAKRNDMVDSNDLEHCPAFVQETYAVYEAFYDPFNTTILNQGEFGAQLNEGLQRVVLPDSIWVAICADVNEFSCPKRYCLLTINEFGPRVSFPGKEILFLSDYRRDVIMEFLGTECSTAGIPQNVLSESEKEARYQYIQQYIRVLPGHWSGWLLCTQPRVDEISFNSDYTEAIIWYRLVYQFGRAMCKKVDCKWVVEYSEIWGIE